MGIRADIKTYLASVSAITSLVSTRIYGVVIDPVKTAGADCIVYAAASSSEGHQLATGTAGYEDRTFQIMARSKDLDNAEAIADAVRSAMKGYKGSAGSSNFLSVMLLDEVDGYDQPEDNSYAGQYVITQTYFIKRVETL